MELGQWFESALLCCAVWRVNLRLYRKLWHCRDPWYCYCYHCFDNIISCVCCVFIFTPFLTWLLIHLVIWMFEQKGIKCIYLDLLVAGINTLSPKETQGEKLLLFFFSIFQLIVHHDGNLGREPESRNQRSKAYPRMLLTGWLYMACLVSFFIQPRTTCPRLIPSTVIWDLPWPSLIKKCPCFPRAETKGKFHRAQLETAINS